MSSGPAANPTYSLARTPGEPLHPLHSDSGVQYLYFVVQALWLSSLLTAMLRAPAMVIDSCADGEPDARAAQGVRINDCRG
eukprot:1121025-Pyramimonas_sp.AAC.1